MYIYSGTTDETLKSKHVNWMEPLVNGTDIQKMLENINALAVSLPKVYSTTMISP